MNTIILSGRLTADPVLKQTTNEKSMCLFTLAVDRGYGEDSVTDFIPCKAWAGAAEYLAKYANKGDFVIINPSRLEANTVTNSAGEKKTYYSVNVTGIDRLQKKRGKKAAEDEDIPY